MSYIEKTKWFLGELKRVKSGAAGFILLIVLIGMALAFPYIANPNDIKNWSGHGSYWDKKMLPRLAPPEWINYFSPTKYPTTRNLKLIYSNYTILNLTKDKDLMTYLKTLQPKVASALEKLSEAQRKTVLNSLRKSIGFEYVVYSEKDLEFDQTGDVPPKNLVLVLKVGPIPLPQGLAEGINVIFERPDGVSISLIPGSTPNLTNPFDINQYGNLENSVVQGLLPLVIVQNKTGSFQYIPENTTLRISLNDYLGSILNLNNPSIVNAMFSPMLSLAGEQYKVGTYLDPMKFLLSKAQKGLLEGTSPVMKGKYIIKVSMLVRLPKGFRIPSLNVEAAKVLGAVYGLMGTDDQGRDLWPALVYGLQWALIIGITVAAISTIIGVLYGVISGYMGGWTDSALVRLAQIVYSLPVLPLLIILAYFFGQSIWNIIWILIAFGWVGIVFTVRSMALQIKESLYIDAAKAVGASSWRIIVRHVFPQVLPYTFASMALSVPGAILSEAGLSYLGLGDPSIVTWGKILHDAQAAAAVINGAWWWVVPPGLGIAIVGLTFVMIGYALDKILNPRLIR